MTPIGDANLLAGEPQAGLWLGKTDDLWQFGKYKGWGGPWREEPVRAGEPSDPYLMTGFDEKVLHLYHDSEEPVEFTIEVDFLGAQNWKTYDTVRVPQGKYVHHEFQAGYGAHRVRIRIEASCRATAHFTYN